jgi:hypothetical protein
VQTTDTGGRIVAGMDPAEHLARASELLQIADAALEPLLDGPGGLSPLLGLLLALAHADMAAALLGATPARGDR